MASCASFQGPTQNGPSFLQICSTGLPGATPSWRCLSRRWHDCLLVVATLGSHWLSSCFSSRAAFARQHTAVNHTICTVLREGGHSSSLEPLLLDPNLQEDSPELGDDQLVRGAEDQPETFVDVANYLSSEAYTLGRITVFLRESRQNEVPTKDP